MTAAKKSGMTVLAGATLIQDHCRSCLTQRAAMLNARQFGLKLLANVT
jgi:hypothetical protein